ncbi:hypothetical protein GWK08_12690 [Leptobacterium flavescens]|uniref:Outer membrane lipoprotein-sorting protein n=1 Tax=Leptobacterium flavescens TaxID=472055 RepID=A0A6P0UP84_9FLAO|nr:hypothetical protein [Leptobacterium flavescens]NER14302.1 hypothetical protein [Leptobacterium flavescens]
MKKTIFLTAILGLFSLVALAQAPTPGPLGKYSAQDPTLFTEGNRLTQYIKENIIDKADPSAQRFQLSTRFIGTAYMEEDFKPGNIYFNNEDKGAYMLRYNIFSEEFETLEADGSNSIVLKTSEVKVNMDGKNYIFKYYLNNDRKEFGYFQVIKEYGTITLLRKYRKLVQEGKRAITSFDVTRPNRLVDREDYFIMINDNEIFQIKESNNKLSRAFKSRGVNLKPYLKENELNVRNEEDLLKALSYVNGQIKVD